MFNLNKFKAMLLNHNVSEEELAQYLDMKLYTLKRRIKASGNFSIDEIRLMIRLFGKEDVFECLFDYSQSC